MWMILFKEEEEKVKAEVIRGTNRKCILTWDKIALIYWKKQCLEELQYNDKICYSGIFYKKKKISVGLTQNSIFKIITYLFFFFFFQFHIFKGLVSVVIICLPSCHSKPEWLSFSSKHKIRYFEEQWGPNNSFRFETMSKWWKTFQFWVNCHFFFFFQFDLTKTKKENHTQAYTADSALLSICLEPLSIWISLGCWLKCNLIMHLLCCS